LKTAPKAPPAPFLNRPFTAAVPELRTFHELIDKGKLTQALQPLEKVKSIRAFQEYLQQRLNQERGSLKSFKNELEAIARSDSSDSMEELSNQIHFLLPHLWEKKESPVIQELLLHAAFFLAWHEKGEASLKEKMTRSLGKQLPSETLWEGLVATEELPPHPGGGAHFGGTGYGENSTAQKHRRLLERGNGRIKGEAPARLGWNLSLKSQTDRYFGYVGKIAIKCGELARPKGFSALSHDRTGAPGRNDLSTASDARR
jgi:hypothetical protein